MITSVSRSFIFIFNLFWEDPRHREAGLVLKQGGWFLLHIPERREKKKKKASKQKKSLLFSGLSANSRV